MRRRPPRKRPPRAASAACPCASEDAAESDSGPWPSVRARQLQDVLANRVKHHLLRYRCDLEHPALPEIALDVVLAHVAISAERLHRAVTRLETGLGGAQLGDIGFGAAGAAMVE